MSDLLGGDAERGARERCRDVTCTCETQTSPCKCFQLISKCGRAEQKARRAAMKDDVLQVLTEEDERDVFTPSIRLVLYSLCLSKHRYAEISRTFSNTISTRRGICCNRAQSDASRVAQPFHNL